MLVSLLFLAAIGCLYGSTMAQTTCVQGQNCVLPNCFCPTFKHPDFPDTKQIPQMVYFGFDDALNVNVDQYYSQIFTKDRKNPNGCPISMSLYVQNQDTSYILVNEYYNNGFEIGSHSVTHTMIDTAEKLRKEAGEQKNNIANEGRIPLTEVVGWRSPNLKTAGDAQPDVLKELGYTYDISLTHSSTSPTADEPWPYTLDFGYPYSCSVQPCPGRTTSHKGFWEIPVNTMYDQQTGYPCVYVDACRPTSEAAALDYLWKNFENNYNGNRAPFGLNMHAAWFFTQDYLKATQAFVDRLLALDDVYIISAKQVLDWMRTPVNVAQAKTFAPWGCSNPQPNLRPHHPPQGNQNARRTTTTTTTTTAPTTTTTHKPLTRPPNTFWSFMPRPTQAPVHYPIHVYPTFAPPVLITYTRHTVGGNTPYFPFTLFPTPQPATVKPTTTTTRAPTTQNNGGFIPGGGPAARGNHCAQNINCHLPSCLCRSLSPPGNLPDLNTPQIIYITITGSVNGVNYQPILSLLEGRKNPNGCPISATFFVPRSGNYVPYVQSLRSRGHEISMYGSDSVLDSRRPLKEHIAAEVELFQTHESSAGLRQGAGGVDLGYRSHSANSLNEGLLEGLQQAGVEYDSSFSLSRRMSNNVTWPYTLDFGWQGCGQDWTPSNIPCPSGKYKGLWEVPIVPLVDYRGEQTCIYADACNNHPRSARDTLAYFLDNFNRNFKSHRLPLGIHLRQEWFYHPFYAPNLKGLGMFLDMMKTRGDVYTVSVERMLDWMKTPTALDSVRSFAKWGC